MNMNDYDRYDLNINIKSLNIDKLFHDRLKKIAEQLEEVKTLTNESDRDYCQLTLRQDLEIIIYNNNYFTVKARHSIDLGNIETIRKLSGFESDKVTINQQGNLELNFHNRNDEKWV